MSRRAETFPCESRQIRIGRFIITTGCIFPAAMDELVHAGYQKPSKGAFFDDFSSVDPSVMFREEWVG
jgi:hypothetical protein